MPHSSHFVNVGLHCSCFSDKKTIETFIEVRNSEAQFFGFFRISCGRIWDREFTCQSLHCFVSSLFSSFRSWSTPKLCKKKLTNYLENWTEHLLWQTNWFFGFAFGVFSWSSFQIWPCVHDHFNFAGLKMKLTLIFFDPNAASHCCRMQEKMSLVAKLTNT